MTARSPERTPGAGTSAPPSQTTFRKTRRCLVLALLFACCVLTGCKSGTLSGSEQACKSTGGFLADKQVACTGSVASVRGEPSLGIIDTDEELDGTYKLDATITVGEGSAKAYVSTDGGQAGGTVSPGGPLRISAVVEVGSDDEDVSVDLKVLGKEVKDLRYEATLVPQD
jgi:hypothetical protein